MRSSPPNVVVVVLDCVRATDFPPSGLGGAGLDFLSEIAHSSFRCDNALAVSPWTIPSHASLLTGKYPWNCKMFKGTELRLPSSVGTLGSVLGEHGYTQLFLSANGIVDQRTGLTRGFDGVVCARWWEKYLRVARHPRIEPRGPKPPRSRLQDLSFRMASDVFGSTLNRYSLANSVLDSVVRGIAGAGQTEHGTPVAPWIEPTVEDWLLNLPPRRPIGLFINLLDAHEPYAVDWEDFPSLSSWYRSASLRMDSSSYVAGTWKPSQRDLRSLYERYVRRIRLMVSRLETLVRILEQSGRWDNTILVVTSDHGQTFGEHGSLFHGSKLWDPLLRVPLWIRVPEGVSLPPQTTSWVSLIDVVPTILQMLGIPAPVELDGLPLSSPERLAERPAVFAMSDGMHPYTMLRLVSDQQTYSAWSSRIVAGVTARSRKIVLEEGAENPISYDLQATRSEETPSSLAADDDADVVLQLRRILSKLSRQPTEAHDLGDLARLASWGYE